MEGNGVSARKILVVAPAWVGDMVMSQVLYSALQTHCPEATIDVLAPRATIDLASRMPEINEAILIDQGHGELGLGYRFRLGRALMSRHYDQVILTPNSLKSSLVPFFAGIETRTGFLGEYRYFFLNDIRLLDERKMPRMVDRFVELAVSMTSRKTRRTTSLESLGKPGIKVPQLTVDLSNQSEFVSQHGLQLDLPIIGLCPGAEFGDAKKWPEEHFVTVAADFIARGHNVWIFGSPADLETGETIRVGVEALSGIKSRCINLAGKTTLLDAVDLLSLCTKVITNDSGLMHIAAAVGCEVLAIFGSTSPDFTPPLSQRAKIIRLDLPCSPCFKRVCPLNHKDCLKTLEPDLVLANTYE